MHQFSEFDGVDPRERAIFQRRVLREVVQSTASAATFLTELWTPGSASRWVGHLACGHSAPRHDTPDRAPPPPQRSLSMHRSRHVPVSTPRRPRSPVPRPPAFTVPSCSCATRFLPPAFLSASPPLQASELSAVAIAQSDPFVLWPQCACRRLRDVARPPNHWPRPLELPDVAALATGRGGSYVVSGGAGGSGSGASAECGAGVGRWDERDAQRRNDRGFRGSTITNQVS